MSRWTHACCVTCFQARHPGNAAHQVPIQDRDLEICCYCWENTTAGIYDRSDPAATRCKGTMTPTHKEGR